MSSEEEKKALEALQERATRASERVRETQDSVNELASDTVKFQMSVVGQLADIREQLARARRQRRHSAQIVVAILAAVVPLLIVILTAFFHRIGWTP